MSPPSYTVHDLLRKVEEQIAECQFDVALSFCQRALELDSNDLSVLESTASVELELGLFEEAQSHLLRYLELDSENNEQIYLSLAQLYAGEDSIRCIKKGLEIMERKLRQAETTGDEKQIQILKGKCSSAFCSIAEIYLTDCCYDPLASDNCNALLEKAINVDPTNPDVYSTMASVRISQCKPDEAKESIKKGIALWYPQYRQYMSDISNPEVPADTIITPKIPSYESRFNATKLCIELELYSLALNILQSCQAEDDENIELWYLYGWTYYLLGERVDSNGVISEDDVELDDDMKVCSKSEWLADAKDCLEAAQKVIAKQQCEDAELVEHISNLLQTIYASGMVEPDMNGAMDEDESGWEDLDDDEDEAMQM
ncbi:hypothetical protein BKA69DRAFT_1035517 [Paraphysoderma sedebokerense]|nr:hypothetical protein BKA69DRAFT_1035517 [Paraphysoderma sedebokerense]